ncbi:MAG: nitrilase-related carbon-nitrogen hydrolase [Phycisphaerales bacterium JB050]
MMRAHLLQMNLAWEDRQANFRKVEAMLDSAEIVPGDLVVLPELFDSGFSLHVDQTADDPPVGHGETRAFLESLARERRVLIHGSWTALAPDGERGLNIAALFGVDGRMHYRYAKIHPFTFGREGERFDGGRDVVCVDLKDAGASESLKATPAICYDLRFPELFRAGLEQGAEAYIIGANWPEARQMHWRTLSIARAIENQAWVLGVNRVGKDPHLGYAGGSMIINPKGEVIAEGDDSERVISAPISRSETDHWRETFPAWKDRSSVFQ